MSEEIKQEDKQITAPPIVHLVLSGIDSTLKFLNKKAEEQGATYTPQEVFNAFGEGVSHMVAKIGFGLHALSQKDERNLLAIQTATKQIEKAGKQDELELKLVVVPKRVEGGLVGTDGRPLSKTPNLIVPK